MLVVAAEAIIAAETAAVAEGMVVGIVAAVVA